MAASTPMPGSTPIRLPMNTPKAAHIRLSSAKAMENPSIRLLKISMADQPQRNSGNCNCSPQENTARPSSVTPADSSAALLTVCCRSPSAEMNTSASVAGTRPPNLPSAMKASSPPMMQLQPRQSGAASTSASSSAACGA